MPFIFLAGCKDDEPTYGQLAIQFKLLYDGEVMPIQDDFIYEYPDGQTQFFLSKFSFFLSDLRIENQLIDELNNDAKLVTFSTAFGTEQAAESGNYFDTLILRTGSYDGLSFGVGVKPVLNKLTPIDFGSASDLSLTGDYWAPWESYIFTKTEGKFKSSAGTEFDEPFALHTGGSEAYQVINIPQSFEINEEEVTIIPIYIDLLKQFDNNGKIYDLVNNPKIHRLDQQDLVDELSENLSNSFSTNK